MLLIASWAYSIKTTKCYPLYISIPNNYPLIFDQKEQLRSSRKWGDDGGLADLQLDHLLSLRLGMGWNASAHGGFYPRLA